MLDLVDAEDALSYTSADSPKGYSNSSGEHGGGQTWEVVRAAIRYVTQKPWNRIPPITRTLIYNPVLACLAGGRNKARRSRRARSVHVHAPGSPEGCTQQLDRPGLCSTAACMSRVAPHPTYVLRQRLCRDRGSWAGGRRRCWRPRRTTCTTRSCRARA